VNVVQDVALRLVFVGLIGVAWMLLYLQACRRADWGVLPAQPRHRALGWQRRAPAVMAMSAGLTGLGLALALAAVVAEVVT
jgi:hypothetical protein